MPMTTTTNHKDSIPFSPERQLPQILVVDDEPLVCWSLEKTLNRAGCRVTSLSCGEKAIELLRTGHFDLVITDLKLPKMDGFHVAEAARAIFPDIPVILISAFGDPSAREHSERLKVNYFFDKPFDLQEITNIVLRLVSLRKENL